MSDATKKRDIRDLLRGAGLRPTRQRLALGGLLFSEGDRHVTAEMLYEEALTYNMPVSLATVYNTLHQFTEAGLLRQVAVNGAKTYFDTNISNHHHFYLDQEGELLDIPGGQMKISDLPEAPDGKEISRVDIIVHVVEKDDFSKL